MDYISFVPAVYNAIIITVVLQRLANGEQDSDMRKFSPPRLLKILLLSLAGLLLAGLLIMFAAVSFIWAWDNFRSGLISAGQSGYESISIYTTKEVEAGYVVVDDPACNRETDFSQIQHFQLSQDSGWGASLPLSADDQGRYFCLRLEDRWRGVDYIAVGPIDTTPPVVTMREVEGELVLQMEWLSASEMGLRRHDNHVAVQAARLQASSACDRSAWAALNNRLPRRLSPASPPGSSDLAPLQELGPHPDHFDISRHLSLEPGSTSQYDSSTQLTLAAIPLAEIPAETDHCFYVFDTRLGNGIYLIYPQERPL